MLLRAQKILSRAKIHIRSLGKKRVLIGTGVVFIALYGLTFFIEKPVHFSYAGKTCIGQLALLPGLQQPTSRDKFDVSYDELKLGSIGVLSRATCFKPTSVPEAGVTKVRTTLLGLPFVSTTFAVATPDVPRLDFAKVPGTIPVARSLKIALSSPDVVHRYTVKANKKEADCQGASTNLSCETKQLQLAQGKRYTIEVVRHFNEVEEVAAKKNVTTLNPVKVTKTSVTGGQTVYTKPKTFEFILDKPITDARVQLKMGNKAIETKVTTRGTKVVATIRSDLERSKEFSLTLDEIEAKDGSTLEKPHSFKFVTSGGPRVTGVSIGKSGVGLSDTIVVQFDQNLSPSTNIAKMVRLTGGNYSVSFRGNQAYVQLQNLPKCQTFTISVAAGLVSEHNVTSNATWGYTSRTTCHTVSVYGYSVHGQPLYAYYFGSGGTTTLFVGAIHGSEPSSMYLLNDWINELEANPQRIPAGHQVVIAPNANPDGVAAGSRNNARNVNLNRNFPTNNWQKDIDDTNGHVAGGGGSAPLSEPEARALASLSQSLRPRLLLSYHAVGSVVIGDPGGYSAGYAATYASMVGYRNATGQSAGTFDYSITGSYEEWTIQKAGIPSIVVELGSYGYRNFYAHKEAFWAMLR